MDALDEDTAADDADAMDVDENEIIELSEAIAKCHFPDVWEKLSDNQRRHLIGK